MRILGINAKFALVVLLVGIVGGWAVHALGVPHIESSDLRQIASTAAQIAATMIGFLLAALAILASIANMRLLRNMQRTGHFQVLLGRMIVAAIYFFLALVFCMTALVIPDQVPYAIPIGAGLLIASCFALADATWKFSVVLFSLKPESKPLEQ
jgi:hypothetical protein